MSFYRKYGNKIYVFSGFDNLGEREFTDKSM